MTSNPIISEGIYAQRGSFAKVCWLATTLPVWPSCIYSALKLALNFYMFAVNKCACKLTQIELHAILDKLTCMIVIIRCNSLNLSSEQNFVSHIALLSGE